MEFISTWLVINKVTLWDFAPHVLVYFYLLHSPSVEHTQIKMAVLLMHCHTLYIYNSVLSLGFVTYEIRF